MDVLGFAALVIGGFTACAEFGSYAFVHPVIRRLPAVQHIEVEQGLLRTFGRVMPVAMTLTLALGVANAVSTGGQGGPSAWRWAAAGAFIAALTSTVIFNVPVNLATGRWDPQHPPDDWKQVRNRWEFFQGLRSWLLRDRQSGRRRDAGIPRVARRSAAIAHARIAEPDEPL